MNHTTTGAALTVAALVIFSAGCGDLVERAAEEAVERAAESDTGVDVEFDDDGISVKSDEGDFDLSVDENGVVIRGTDADGNDFSVDADENGIDAQGKDGTFDLDSDGTFTATDADGEVTSGQIAGDGDSIDVTVDGEDGDAVFTSGEGIPDQWPSDVPRPDGLEELVGTFVSGAGDSSIVVTGRTGASARDAFDAYADRLTDDGFTESSKLNQGSDFHSATFARGDTTVSVTTQSTGGSTDVIIALD